MTTPTGVSSSCPYLAWNSAIAAWSVSSRSRGKSPFVIGQKYAAGVPRLDSLAAFRLDGRVAIVTGASSGLGARFARVLDGAGARVVLAARRHERLEELAGELTDALPVSCDVAEPDAPAALVDATLGRFGRVDVLVNNAGIDALFPAMEEPVETFRDVLEVNL